MGGVRQGEESDQNTSYVKYDSIEININTL